MRRDHLIPPSAEVNPAYDLDATALLVAYYIGDDRDPDEVVAIVARGDFRIDTKLRDEIRAIPIDPQCLHHRIAFRFGVQRNCRFRRRRRTNLSRRHGLPSPRRALHAHYPQESETLSLGRATRSDRKR